MRPTLIRFTLVAALILALAAAVVPPLHTQPAPADEAPGAVDRFGEEISITEIEIPVQVLRRGEPVRGLSVDDFEVYDAGEPRPIVAFRVIDLSEGSLRTAPGEPGEALPAEPEPEGRRILLMFDFLFSRRHHLERSLLGSREMLARQLHPSDRIAVAYLTGSGANLVLGFTRDREEVAAALDVVHALIDLRQEDARAAFVRLARMQGLASGPPPAAASQAADDGSRTSGPAPRTRAAELNERFGAAAAVALLGGADPETDAARSATFGTSGFLGDATFDDGDAGRDPVVSSASFTDPFDIGRSLAAEGVSSTVKTLTQEMGRLATLLRDVPGQKHMLYFSEGFASNIINNFASGQRALVLRYVEDLFESLRRAGWTLHAVDVGGIPDAFGERGFDADSLHYMAAETGGQLFENYNRIHQATERLIERTSVTYVLTVRPPADLPANGHLRRLDVRVKDAPRGTRVLHRTGYYAPKPTSERSPLERQLDTVDLVLGHREVDQMGSAVLAGALPSEDGLIPVPVVVEVPGEAFRASGGRTVALQIQVYALDEQGGVQDVWLRRLDLERERMSEQLAHGGLRILGSLAVPPGEYRVRVMVRDLASNRMSLTTTPLSIAPGDGGLLPIDPVIVDRSGEWVEVVSLPAGAGGAVERAFSLAAGVAPPVVPPVTPTVRSWQGAELLVVVADAAGEVDLTARLLDDQGREIEGSPVRFVDRLPGRDGAVSRYLALVATTDLVPGSYRVEVRASGDPGEPPSTRGVSFRVRE